MLFIFILFLHNKDFSFYADVLSWIYAWHSQISKLIKMRLFWGPKSFPLVSVKHILIKIFLLGIWITDYHQNEYESHFLHVGTAKFQLNRFEIGDLSSQRHYVSKWRQNTGFCHDLLINAITTIMIFQSQ